MKKELHEIYNNMRNCSKCSGAMEFKGKPRFGFPPSNDYLAMIIGAEPGPAASGELTPKEYRERFSPQASGKNKVQLLFKYLDETGPDKTGENWKRFFFTNSVKCPPGLNPPEKKLKECFRNCEKYLNAQIQTIKPRLIIVIGKSAKRLGIDQNLKYLDSDKNAKKFGIRNPANCPIGITKFRGIKALSIRHPQGAEIGCLKKIAVEVWTLLSQ